MKRLIIAMGLNFALLGGLGAPAQAQSKTTTPMVSNGHSVVYGFRPYGSIAVAAMLKDVGGKTAVCGFWTVRERLQAYVLATNLDRRRRQAITVKVGNVRLLTGVDFMNEVDSDDYKAGTQATCQITNFPWKPAYKQQDIEFLAPRVVGRT